MKSLQDEWLLSQLQGRTFDDFLGPPDWAVATSRKGLDLSTKFSEHINLSIPLVSANMDTITGARMATALAKEGGIGIIHRYLSIEDECQKVLDVKREHSYVIENPLVLSRRHSIAKAKEEMRIHKVSGVLVEGVQGSGILVGILTHRDILAAGEDDSAMVDRYMTHLADLVMAQPGISIDEAEKIMLEKRIEKIPLVTKPGRKICGLITLKDLRAAKQKPYSTKDKKGRLMVGAAIGATGDYLERAFELIKAGVGVIVIDIANAQSNIGLNATKSFRKRFPDMELVVGNIAIPLAIEKYKDLGVNGFKVGLGPGSACTTRYHTNIGVSQAQAIYDCSRESKVPIIADGGIRRDGHVYLSLMFGGSSVMLGGLLGGTDESPGHTIRNSKGDRVKKFRGMASREAMFEKLMSEFNDDPYEMSSRISPEGIEKELEYRGSVVPIINDMMNHLASSISYLGAKSLKEAQEIFMANPQKYLTKISHAAQIESWHRDV